MTHHHTSAKISAQIACEAIINHEDEGYTLRDLVAVFEIADREGVASFYVDDLADRIARRVREIAREIGLVA